MRRTFPFLEQVVTTELVSQDMLPVMDGKITMSLPIKDIVLADDTIVTFSLCPEGVTDTVDRCRRGMRREWDREREQQARTPAS